MVRERLYTLYYRDPISRKFVAIEGADVLLRIDDDTGDVRPVKIAEIAQNGTEIKVRKPLRR